MDCKQSNGKHWFPFRSRVKPIVRQSLRTLESLESRRFLALTVETIPASEIGLRSAQIGIELKEADGAKPQLVLYWGDEDGGTESRNWDHAVNFPSASLGQYTTRLTDLQIGSNYFYRGFALNIFGGATDWTDVATFQTLPARAATLSVSAPTHLSGTSIDVSGQVVETGGDPPKIYVVAGPVDAGNDPSQWPKAVDLGIQEGSFHTRLEGLNPATAYVGRVIAVNSSGRTSSDLLSWTTRSVAPLRISEFLAANGSIGLSRLRANPEATFPKTLRQYDWIELQNSTAEPLDISGYHLTDNAAYPQRWAFPAGTTIPAHGFLVVYASGEDVTDPRLDEQGRLHTNFQLARTGEYLALTDRAGQVIDAYDELPTQYRDVSYGVFNQAAGHLTRPTPGAANDPLPPGVLDVEHTWATNDVGGPLVVTARIAETDSAVTQVQLTYRVMFAAEVSVPMADDGVAPDRVAGDGMFTGTVPGQVATAGQMIRYYVTAFDSSGLMRREPTFVDPLNSPQYLGTVVPDASVVSPLPLFERFVETTRLADSARGTRASVYYAGEFYDNVFVRIRGGTARDWPKKSYKFEFNDDHQFKIRDGIPRVTEVDVNATYTDKSYVRPTLTAEFQTDVGTPAPDTFHIRMHQNGAFFSVANMVEQVDTDFLRRTGLDPQGSLYKAGPGSFYTGGTGSYEKKNRDDEDKSDLNTFINGLKATGADLEKFLFDHVNLPAQINFMASVIITQNIDATDKNHFIYRDTNGTGEWHMIPWDLDLVFGPDALNTDVIVSDQNTRGASNPTAVHPFLGSRAFPLHVGKINAIMDGLIVTPRTREMLLRRIRTMADEYLGTRYFYERIDELVALLAQDVPVDRAKWKTQAHFGGTAAAFETVAERIKKEYLDRRYPYLTNYHVNGGVGIPAAQPNELQLELGAITEFAPASGRAGDEYFTLKNPYAFPVDLSNWQVGGATTFGIRPGTVLPAGETMYFTANVAEFRARASGPRGQMGLFVQGYAQRLPQAGGLLTLHDPAGRLAAQKSYGVPIMPADAKSLQITEIHYNPTDGNPAFGEARMGGAAFEFVELTNIATQPIELAGVEFNNGINFKFAPQILEPAQSVVVVKSREAFVSRYRDAIRLAEGSDGLGGLPSEFDGRLADGGERLTLVDGAGQIIQDFTFDDELGWPVRADAKGSSLELIDRQADPAWPSSWMASSSWNGSPGTHAPNLTLSVQINEVFSNAAGTLNDQIELYNPSDLPIDVSGWYLASDANLSHGWSIGGGAAVVPARGFLALNATRWGGEPLVAGPLWLIQPESPATVRPKLLADFVEVLAPWPGRSQGRYVDGASHWRWLQQPTAGRPNQLLDPSTSADWNQDQRVDGADLALLCAAIREGRRDERFDLDRDALIDDADLDILVQDLLRTNYGDANLDGRFDSQDIVHVMQAGRYQTDALDDADWTTGDWNCDGEFDTSDLIAALSAGGYVI